MTKKSILVLIVLLAVAGTIQGATEAAKQAAIDKGLAWLASTQQADGRWAYADIYQDTAVTGAALLAFEEEGYFAGSNVIIDTGGGPVNYGDVVGKGLGFLFANAQPYAIGPQSAGNPDSDGDGLGVKFVLGGDNGRDIYVTGLALPAIASTGTPGAVVANGPLAGQTYLGVVRDTVDYLAYAQNEAAYGGDPSRGGWRYYANAAPAQGSDNSTSQWPVVGMLFAQNMGVGTPQFVKDELRYWTDYIQNGDGGSDYDTAHGWGSNVSRTGTWLLQANVIGTDPTQVTNADLNAALAYLNGQWNTGANSTWNGNFGHPYGMWAAYKGLEGVIGLDADTSVITPRAQGGAIIDNPNHGWNWWEDYCEFLVSGQNGDGSWNGYDYWYGPLATAWYINILAATEIPGPGIPAPAAVLLGGIGVGLVGWLRRRRSL